MTETVVSLAQVQHPIDDLQPFARAERGKPRSQPADPAEVLVHMLGKGEYALFDRGDGFEKITHQRSGAVFRIPETAGDIMLQGYFEYIEPASAEHVQFRPHPRKKRICFGQLFLFLPAHELVKRTGLPAERLAGHPFRPGNPLTVAQAADAVLDIGFYPVEGVGR